jgi:hypothetical protein
LVSFSCRYRRYCWGNEFFAFLRWTFTGTLNTLGEATRGRPGEFIESVPKPGDWFDRWWLSIVGGEAGFEGWVSELSRRNRIDRTQRTRVTLTIHEYKLALDMSSMPKVMITFSDLLLSLRKFTRLGFPSPDFV